MASKNWPRPQNRARDRLRRTRKDPQVLRLTRRELEIMAHVEKVDGVLQGVGAEPQTVVADENIQLTSTYTDEPEGDADEECCPDDCQECEKDD